MILHTISRKWLGSLVLFGGVVFPSLSLANEVYQCAGEYNTNSKYDHIYTVNRSLLGDTLDWAGQTFKLKSQPNSAQIYAVAIQDNGVDVLFIDTSTLYTEFSSIRFFTQFIAKGKCKRLE